RLNEALHPERGAPDPSYIQHVPQALPGSPQEHPRRVVPGPLARGGVPGPAQAEPGRKLALLEVATVEPGRLEQGPLISDGPVASAKLLVPDVPQSPQPLVVGAQVDVGVVLQH